MFQEAKRNVKGFKELFARFLEETGPSVEWEKIKPPREGSVSHDCISDVWLTSRFSFEIASYLLVKQTEIFFDIKSSVT